MSFRPSLMSSLAALVLGAAAQPSMAAISWQYLSSYNSSGAPTNMVNISNQLPTGLLDEIYKRLPEGRNISKNDPALITDDLGANINLLEDAEITVAVVNEGAGYRNSLGFFSRNADNLPKSFSDLNIKIMFPDFSTSPATLKFGDSVKLGKFKAGTAVGFTIVSNGWTGKGVNANQSMSTIFHTIKALNPEPAGTANLNAHTVLLSKPESELLVMGFEDINRTQTSCDHDFNDVIIAIKVSPFSAIDRSQVQSLSKVVKDSDGDGISDDLDAFPLDPQRAGRRFYPSATGYASLAFEDNWPSKGDFDMNDLVVAYRAVEILNARNEIVDLNISYQITARGGAAENGFALHLPGVSRSLVNAATSTLKIRDQAPTALPLESGQTDAVFVLSPKVNDLTRTNMKWPCAFFNTVNSCPRFSSVPLVADIHFNQPISRAQLGSAPYNPFIYNTVQRGREVHLVDHPPTAKADLKLFGTGDDASNPSLGRYYRTKNDNLPWALDVPENWRHPAEWNDVADAYMDFAPWASSTTTVTGVNWFVSNIKDGLVFQR